MNNPMNKLQFKKIVKLKVCEYWQSQFAAECADLSSLCYFNPRRASVLTSHSIWKYAGGSPYEVNKSIVAAKMLSGRYRTEALSRHWFGNNSGGFCIMSTCNNVFGDLEHLLLICPAFKELRTRLLTYWKQKICHLKPVLDHFLRLCNGSTNNFVAFLLNPSANSDLLCLTQTYGSFVIEQTMYLARTFIFSLHREKLKLTGRWPNYF